MNITFTPESTESSRAARFMPRRALRGFLCAMLMPAGLYAQQTDTLVTARDTGPNTRMVIFQNGGFLLSGDHTGSNSALVPIEGAGTRVMWHPERAAFRAGMVSGDAWDRLQLGDHSVAMGNDVRATASSATAFGLRTRATHVSSFAVGENSVASGPSSVAMGYHASTNSRSGSFVFGDRSTPDTLLSGVNHSASWRTSGGFRIYTSSNLTTGLTIQSGAQVSNWGQVNAVISTSTGAYLSTGGIWENVSDVNKKHRFENISCEEILQKIRKLPVTKWGYKAESENISHVGPMAQDFYAAFGLGSDNRSIGTVDADGVALAGIKALEERTRNLAAELENLKADNAALRQQVQNNNGNSWMGFAGLGLLALGGILLIARRGMIPDGSRMS